MPTSSSDASSAGMSVHAVTANIITDLNASLAALQRTLGSLGEEQVQGIRTDADAYIDSRINSVKDKMEASDASHQAQTTELQALLKKVFDEELVAQLKDLIHAEVLEQIDDLVKAEVQARLPEYLSEDLQEEMRRQQAELADLERQLHNSESAGANAALRDVDEAVHPLYNTKGEISANFPKKLADLFDMTNETAISLLRDYAPDQEISDSRENNVNAFMHLCGVRYRLVSVGGGPAIPCSPTTAARAGKSGGEKSKA
ncbi:hypothetical protein BD414DRAFT_494867 [Trametes punicea]|nr:hypothetical protein BD414DRAFT_494867 [Trametes punicea]